MVMKTSFFWFLVLMVKSLAAVHWVDVPVHTKYHIAPGQTVTIMGDSHLGTSQLILTLQPCDCRLCRSGVRGWAIKNHIPQVIFFAAWGDAEGERLLHCQDIPGGNHGYYAHIKKSNSNQAFYLDVFRKEERN
ncbi:hypothetical protein PGT21_008453 [Puccinia graminis f. sp. tritici]|uniref:Uncharacterized protein n=1 Tax=Puccinia graminis f. sp. tritici TaxID=56615 RepID=A0A5B0QVX1_PUCGR|nr:hypothetical protein PGT21_008686 [Puccinia graminis f. sp. tritici]KAA1117471.1 hypothetical protein PGT21_008453 [Puccinia graminis f. sp. tritici]KAA1123279.1 hypothetical protein PGTUg99_019367 [Puccinia graminis f. sp. tritici]